LRGARSGHHARPVRIIGHEHDPRTILKAARANASRRISVTAQNYYRSRRELGGPEMDQARRPKELVEDNAQLRRALFGDGH
jgi:hypothetical protein